ncbi:MAG: hypothetical protein HYZ54_03985 [Ignavibacteriae bacterium]|nr:hypothetical protein [Ignavibacteriota bacterium]
MPRIFLIDSMGLVFRAYHALSKLGLQTPSGEPTSAVFGFASIIGSLIEREQPDYIAAVFDTKEPTFRHKLYDNYKANRLAFPEELVPQLGRIKELIDALGICRIELPGFEADDIVGTLARMGAEKGMEVLCITSDKDYFQLVGENISVLRPGKDASEYDIYGREEVLQKFGVYPESVIDYLALIGDSSDNVPGVKGIGEKSALPLIEKFGTIEQIYERLHEVEKDAIRTKLTDSREMAFLSKELVTIHKHVPISISLEDCCRKIPDRSVLDALLTTLNFTSLRKKWKTFEAAPLEQASDTVGTAESGIRTIGDVPHEYKLVATNTDFNAMLIDLQPAQILSFDLETTSLDEMNCSIVGIALSASEGRAYYIATNEDKDLSVQFDSTKATDKTSSMFDTPKEEISTPENPPGEQGLPLKFVLIHLKAFLEGGMQKIGQNAKFDAKILRRFGVNVSPITFDTMLASYILNPDMQHGMDALARHWMHYSPIPITSLIGEKKQGSMRDVPLEKVAEYAAEDADVTLKLRNILHAELSKQGLLKFAERVEFPLVDVLTDMWNHSQRWLIDKLVGYILHIIKLSPEPVGFHRLNRICRIFLFVLRLGGQSVRHLSHKRPEQFFFRRITLKLNFVL